MSQSHSKAGIASFIISILNLAGFMLGIFSLFANDTKKLFGMQGSLMSIVSGIVFLVLVIMFSLMSPGM